MKLYTLILLLLLNLQVSANSTLISTFPTEATLKLHINENSGVETLQPYYYDNCWDHSLGFFRKQAIEGTEKKTFKLEISKSNPIAYFSIIRTSKNKYSFPYFDGYIVEPGDNIDVFITQDSEQPFKYVLSFKGRGSAKYQCQFEFDKIAREMVQKYGVNPKYNSKNGLIVKDSLYYANNITQLNWQIKAQTETFKARLQILEKYKPRLKLFIYNLLKAQIFGALEYNNLLNLSNAYFQLDKAELANSISILKENLKGIYLNRFQPNIRNLPENVLALSSNYLRFIVKRTADTIIKKGNHYFELRDHFSGFLRDRLVAAYFSKSFFQIPNSDVNVADALRYVKIDYCRDVLTSLNSSLAKGKPAYNFALPDSSGKIVKLSDLKGKVVVMDFWFTGCGACRTLTEQMKPIVKKFEKNDEIVFLSVSIDKDVKLWKNTLNTGLYSHDKSIDLITNLPGGREIINHYRIYGYPTVIVVGKDGRIITGNPPLPANSNGEKALIELLEKSII